MSLGDYSGPPHVCLAVHCSLVSPLVIGQKTLRADSMGDLKKPW